MCNQVLLFKGNHELGMPLYLSETMISGQFAGCGARAFPRAHQLCAFEIVVALKTLPFLLDPGNSVRREMNKLRT